MNVYKFIITKTVFVEAKNKAEAKELLEDEDFIMIDEKTESITLSSRKEMRRMFMNESEETE